MLGRLTADPARFAARSWGRTADLSERLGPFSDLFSLDAADALLGGVVQPPAVRMVRAGSVLAPGDYCRPTRVGGRLVDHVVDPRRIADQLAAGATLVFQSLHRQVRPLTAFADRLTADLGHPVQVNAYLTPPAAVGLAEHADEHDVFAVQLDGTKHWWVDGLGHVTLRPDDVLYIPAGCRHRAEAQHESSLHLTVGVLRVTYRHVIERVLRQRIDELDTPLPLGYRADRAADVERGGARALAAAIARLQTAVPAQIAATERERVIPAYARHGHLASAAGLERITPATSIRWVTSVPTFAAAPDSDDGRRWVHVDLGDRRLRIPAVGRAAIEFIAREGCVAVGSLPGLDPASQCAVARRLVGERACVIEPS